MDTDSALSLLNSQSNLTILHLASPFLTRPSPNTTTRDSNSPSHHDVSPAILLADLQHYQDLFSKLRFSYVEQVTKERFLRAITVNEPEFVDASENGALEEKLREDKAALKERKNEVRELVGSLEEQGRELARRYDTISLQTTQLSSLPPQITNLEATIAQLQVNQAPRSENPDLNLSLQPTLDLLASKEDHLSSLDRQIAALRAALPHKQNEVAALTDEVSILNAKKIKAVEEAQLARRRRENGGVGDEIDERGRWLRGVDVGLRAMLEV